MDRVLIVCLKLLGCTEKHIRFYRASALLGAATIGEIAKKARLQRSTAYLVAAELVSKGLVSEDHRTYKKHFIAARPEMLLQKLEAAHRQLGRNALAFKEVLPELRAAYQAPTARPRVRTYEGKASLPTVWRDILGTQQEILVWTNQQTESLVFGDGTHDQFIRERVAKKISIRVLAVNNEEGRDLLLKDSASLRQTKILPPDVFFTSETYIYGNTVTVLDVGRDIFGVITENEQVAASQRAIFEFTWRALKTAPAGLL